MPAFDKGDCREPRDRTEPWRTQRGGSQWSANGEESPRVGVVVSRSPRVGFSPGSLGSQQCCTAAGFAGWESVPFGTARKGKTLLPLEVNSKLVEKEPTLFLIPSVPDYVMDGALVSYLTTLCVCACVRACVRAYVNISF